MVNKIKCDICKRELSENQLKIEKRINKNDEPCFCKIIKEIDKKNKKIKKLTKENWKYWRFINDEDYNLSDCWMEWKDEDE